MKQAQEGMDTCQTVITAERPDTPDAMALIAELEAELSRHYAPESQHGYSVQKLIDQGVAFFVTRRDGAPAGCGGIQVFGGEYGELKRMYEERGYAQIPPFPPYFDDPVSRCYERRIA